jgi:hypothetical protein
MTEWMDWRTSSEKPVSLPGCDRRRRWQNEEVLLRWLETKLIQDDELFRECGDMRHCHPAVLIGHPKAVVLANRRSDVPTSAPSQPARISPNKHKDSQIRTLQFADRRRTITDNLETHAMTDFALKALADINRSVLPDNRNRMLVTKRSMTVSSDHIDEAAIGGDGSGCHWTTCLRLPK